MREPQQIVDDARAALQFVGPRAVEYLRTAATELNALCVAANERLGRALSLLRQGMRSEALRLCDEHPQVLELVALLDFPESEQFAAALAQGGLPVPPPLLIEAAAELNEAYAREHPVAHLLDQHRLLALARAPLAQRLEIVRRLNAADGDNPLWPELQREYEAARLDGLAAEVRTATQGSDVDSLARLLAEVQSSDWLRAPPPALEQTIAQGLRRAQRRQARAVVAQLEPELNATFAALDVAQGRGVRERLLQVLEPAALEPADSLWQMLQPALDWLQEEDHRADREAAREAALGRLEHALDRETDGAELERLHHAAERSGEALPGPVERRYRQRQAALQLTAVRRRRVVLAAVLGCVLAVGGGVVWIVRQQMHAGRVRNEAQALARLLSEGKLDEAAQFLAQVESAAPAVAAAPQIRAVASDLAQRQQVELDRAGAFAEHVARARSDGATVDAAAVEEARRLAQGEAELAVVAELEAALRTYQREQQALRVAALQEEIDLADVRLRGLDDALETRPPAEVRVEAQTLFEKLESLRERSAAVDATLGRQVEPLVARASALIEHCNRSVTQAAASSQVTAAVGDPAAFAAALVKFAEQHADSPLATDFAAVAAERPAWETALAYSELAPALRWDPAAAAGEQLAATCTAAAELLQQPPPPDATALRIRLAALEAVQQRAELQAALDKALRGVLFQGLDEIQLQNGERYYFRRGDIEGINKDGNATHGMQPVVAFDLSLDKKARSIAEQSIDYCGPARQTELCRQLCDELPNLTRDWEGTILKLCGLVLRADEVEVLLRHSLLLRLLKDGGEGSQCFATVYADYLSCLARADVSPLANWLQPDPVVEQQQERAAAALAALRQLDAGAHHRALQAALAELSRPAWPRREWIGWLTRDGAGGPLRCQAAAGTTPNGALLVIYPSGAALACEVIGEVRNGSAVLRDDAPSLALRTGRPVFVELTDP